jgi:hypothetical protein
VRVAGKHHLCKQFMSVKRTAGPSNSILVTLAVHCDWFSVCSEGMCESCCKTQPLRKDHVGLWTAGSSSSMFLCLKFAAAVVMPSEAGNDDTCRSTADKYFQAFENLQAHRLGYMPSACGKTQCRYHQFTPGGPRCRGAMQNFVVRNGRTIDLLSSSRRLNSEPASEAAARSSCSCGSMAMP